VRLLGYTVRILFMAFNGADEVALQAPAGEGSTAAVPRSKKSLASFRVPNLAVFWGTFRGGACVQETWGTRVAYETSTPPLTLEEQIDLASVRVIRSRTRLGILDALCFYTGEWAGNCGSAASSFLI